MVIFHSYVSLPEGSSNSIVLGNDEPITHGTFVT